MQKYWKRTGEGDTLLVFVLARPRHNGMTLSARMCRKVKLLLETRWTLNRVVLLFLLHCKDALDEQASSLAGILQPTALPNMSVHLGLIRGRRSVILKCWASNGHVWTAPTMVPYVLLVDATEFARHDPAITLVVSPYAICKCTSAYFYRLN
jgi:hypothetical protein